MAIRHLRIEQTSFQSPVFGTREYRMRATNCQVQWVLLYSHSRRRQKAPIETWSLSLSKCPYSGIPSTHTPSRHALLAANVPPSRLAIRTNHAAINRCRSRSFVGRPANNSLAGRLPQDDSFGKRVTEPSRFMDIAKPVILSAAKNLPSSQSSRTQQRGKHIGADTSPV